MSPPNCFLLCLSCPVRDQLIIEEMLLHNNNSNWCILNTDSPPAIVMGITGKSKTLLFEDAIKKDNVPVIRRFSGGGTVLIEKETVLVSFIQNNNESSVFPEKLMRITKEFYQPIFPTNFDVRENDYVIGDKKIGGNAQYIRKHRWLHHTSFLWNYDKDKHKKYLKIPQQQPAYRQNRPHTTFLTPLKEWFSEKNILITKILQRLHETREITLITPSSIHKFLQGSPRKSSVTSVII